MAPWRVRSPDRSIPGEVRQLNLLAVSPVRGRGVGGEAGDVARGPREARPLLLAAPSALP